ncbi:hypothetical protein niasHS_010611 [Heterodera schachtii]|uniref:RRM domain-containing protein n=2 Tax=Heterodera TaxID=34509 RepID=A0ABD2IS31_HETSC
MAQLAVAAPLPPTTNATGATATPAAPSYPMASLYVGDLHPEVTESLLFEKFSVVGPVLSIRVCRDAISRRSLGYAYVNFQQTSDAEKALNSMNFDCVLGKQIRIMWSQRDPSIRRSGSGNIFIKNLDKDIDTKNFFSTFSAFGRILSCKVATDSDGKSKGYGFIHYASEDDANKAIGKINGIHVDGKTVFAGKFIPRCAREKQFGNASNRYTNVYVKNFGDLLDTEKIKEVFGKFGEITSAKVMEDADGKPRGFGFVNYLEHENAAKAVEQMHGSLVPNGKPDQKFTVCRAQKKSERQAELRRRYEQYKCERIQRYNGTNLYVKNLVDTINDETLKGYFDSYGKITSVKIMCDESGRSKGFGFVCFEHMEAASKAVVEMNNKIIAGKPLYVAPAQRKDDRKALLASQYIQRLASMRLQNPTGILGTMYAPANGGFFLPQPIHSQRVVPFMQTPNLSGAQVRDVPRWNNVGTFNPTQLYMVGNAGAATQQYVANNQVARGQRVGPIGSGRGPYGGGQPRQQQNRMPGMGHL